MRTMIVISLLLTLSACGGGVEEFDRVPVTGRVVCKGEPVALARVAFNPLAEGNSAIVGKQGLGKTDIDGTFTISTYDIDDGAVIGKHSVRVWMDENTCDCVVGDTIEVQQVDVVVGEPNHFEINLKEASEQELKIQNQALMEDFEDDE